MQPESTRKDTLVTGWFEAMEMKITLTYQDFTKFSDMNPFSPPVMFTALAQTVTKVVLPACSLSRALILFELTNGPSITDFRAQYPNAIRVNDITAV